MLDFKNLKMPKDVVLSTKTFVLSHLILLILALVFFAGLYYILYPERFEAAAPNYNPVTKESAVLYLEIGAPEDDVLVYDNSLVISGKTGPNAAVIMSSSQSDVAMQANKNGEFSKVFPLTPGANIIEITAFDSEGNSKSVTKSVFFSEEKI